MNVFPELDLDEFKFRFIPSMPIFTFFFFLFSFFFFVVDCNELTFIIFARSFLARHAEQKVVV